MAQSLPCKLSICIATFNRAAFIVKTLDNLVAQLTADCEIVISDNASTDDTERVVSDYARHFGQVRYVRQDTNQGLDRNYDCVVSLARGEYCWLMSDDDLLKPGAVTTVLNALRRDLSLVIVNVEASDFTMSKVLQPRCLNFTSDRVYAADEMDRLVLETGDILRFIGCLIVKRSIWLMRKRERYYGSLFIHLGVIFQERLPGEMMVIAEPIVNYRMGNTHAFSPKLFETFMVDLPLLVWSLSLSDSAKTKIQSEEPWRRPDELLLYRALGAYTFAEYRRWIRPRLLSFRQMWFPALVALLPPVLVNTLLVSYYSAISSLIGGVWQPEMVLEELRTSRFHLRNWLVSKRTP